MDEKCFIFCCSIHYTNRLPYTIRFCETETIFLFYFFIFITATLMYENVGISVSSLSLFVLPLPTSFFNERDLKSSCALIDYTIIERAIHEKNMYLKCLFGSCRLAFLFLYLKSSLIYNIFFCSHIETRYIVSSIY